MRLTQHTDYALRVLIHLAMSPSVDATIPQIAAAHQLSENHLRKVVLHLAKGGFLATRRGRGGGFALAQPAESISLRAVVLHTETDMRMVDCTGCKLRPVCGLPRILNEAASAFLGVLDSYTLADVVQDRLGLVATLNAMSNGPETPGAISDP